MWKIEFLYNDGGKTKVTGKGKEITLQQAIKYHNQFGVLSNSETYQRSPYKDNQPEALQDVITRLQKERIKTKNPKKIIAKLFQEGYDDEKEVLETMAGLGYDKEKVKELLMYDFGLDPETIETL